MLRKNYESVLKALDRAEAMKAQFADTAAEAEHRVTEIQIQSQLQLDEVVGESILLPFYLPLLLPPCSSNDASKKKVTNSKICNFERSCVDWSRNRIS